MADPFAELSDRLLPESAFDEAFDRVDPVSRAWIKKNISQLHSMYSHGGCPGRRVDLEWSQGFQSRMEERPFAGAAVCFPSRLLASPRLVAAVLPPLAAGVQRCCAVRFGARGEQWDPLLLAALELAGIEEVYEADPEGFQAWVANLGQDSGTRLVFLEEPEAARGAGASCGGPVLLPAVAKLGLWFEEPEQWDLEALRIAHPRAELLVGGPAAPKAEYPRERVVEGSAEELFAAGPDALYVPPSLFREAASRCSRVLGPGQEGCWIWPELAPESFLKRTLCLSQSDSPSRAG